MYRDDETAREERLAALEREAERAEILEQRVRELEAEIRGLRAQLAARPPAVAVPTVGPHDDIYLDAKVMEYIQRIVDATRDVALADRILSGALPIDASRIADRAREIARQAPRRYATPTDAKRAARELLPARIIPRAGTSDAIVELLLDQIEVP